MLVVRTVPDVGPRQATDLTARARIRDAAIDCFAEQGLDASFRVIAQRAGVSPGLITHHFGSKAALRAECDAEVLRRYRALKRESIASPSGYLLASLTAPGASAAILVYLLRAIHAGGQPARAFLDHLIDDVRPVMAEGVAAGLLRPSRDEAARLRYLTYQTLGALLVHFVTTPGTTPEEFVASLRADGSDTILPMLEVLTEGVVARRDMLDDYLAFLGEPPDDEARHGTPPPAV
jgi:AcrR family transcriptional regulator